MRFRACHRPLFVSCGSEVRQALDLVHVGDWLERGGFQLVGFCREFRDLLALLGDNIGGLDIDADGYSFGQRFSMAIADCDVCVDHAFEWLLLFPKRGKLDPNMAVFIDFMHFRELFPHVLFDLIVCDCVHVGFG